MNKRIEKQIEHVHCQFFIFNRQEKEKQVIFEKKKKIKKKIKSARNYNNNENYQLIGELI